MKEKKRIIHPYLLVITMMLLELVACNTTKADVMIMEDESSVAETEVDTSDTIMNAELDAWGNTEE